MVFFFGDQCIFQWAPLATLFRFAFYVLTFYGALGGVNPRPCSVRDLQTFHVSRWILPLMSVQLVILSNEIVTNFILYDPS
jgi:hypothetical protein